MSFGSDSAAQAPEGPFLLSNPHPRSYGNFARLLAKRVRDEKGADARGRDPPAHRAARGQPVAGRPGRLTAGYYADVWCSTRRASRTTRRSTVRTSNSTGVSDVLVNGRRRSMQPELRPARSPALRARPSGPAPRGLPARSDEPVDWSTGEGITSPRPRRTGRVRRRVECAMQQDHQREAARHAPRT